MDRVHGARPRGPQPYLRLASWAHRPHTRSPPRRTTFDAAGCLRCTHRRLHGSSKDLHASSPTHPPPKSPNVTRFQVTSFPGQIPHEHPQALRIEPSAMRRHGASCGPKSPNLTRFQVTDCGGVSRFECCLFLRESEETLASPRARAEARLRRGRPRRSRAEGWAPGAAGRIVGRSRKSEGGEDPTPHRPRWDEATPQ